MDAPLEIDVTTAAKQAQAGALVLDVRESFEVAICAIPGTRHIPMRQIPESMPELPRDQPILVLCHRGVRSLHVTQFLRANGFTRVTNIAGGIDAWAAQVDQTLARY